MHMFLSEVKILLIVLFQEYCKHLLEIFIDNNIGLQVGLPIHIAVL